MGRTRATLFVGLVLSFSAGACTDGSTPSRTATTGTPGTATPTSTATTAQLADCRLSQLNVSISSAGAAGGHSGARLYFRNTSGTTCRMYGYPGVAALNAAGAQLAQARRTLSGYIGGMPDSGGLSTVELAPGQSASAVVEALNANTDGSSCGTVPALLVTPPNETQSIRLEWSGGCADFEIHPVVPGVASSGPR